MLAVGTMVFTGSTIVQAMDPPEGWVPISITDEARTCGSYSKSEWEVNKLSGAHVTITPHFSNRPYTSQLPFEIIVSEGENGLVGDRQILRVTDGWLIGFDAGEWGGALWWFNEDGANRRKLLEENVRGLIETRWGILVLTGLAHLSLDQGKVFRLHHSGVGEWEPDQTALLDGAPQTFISESPDTVLVITNKSLVRLRSGLLDALTTSVRYEGLSPNSVVLAKDGVIYVGMRHFVTRLTPRSLGYHEEWFVPNTCKRFELKEYDCVCLQ